jgi:pimeloyl-ACP methyl ester carboxylesterase
MNRSLVVLALALLAGAAVAELPTIPPIARRLPGPGEAGAVTDAELTQINQQLEAAKKKLTKLPAKVNKADADVFIKAVELAVKYNEFYKKGNGKKALDLLKLTDDRIAAMSSGKSPWNSQTGNIVRGYYSAIDGSVQPYGLEIPANFDPRKPTAVYVWLHGRGDTATDLHFIAGRMGTKPGQVKPESGIVLHAFGRQCIGWKSAGEIDVFEAIDDAAKHYKIDRDRIALMGFSMGGAGAWHMGAHYADQWCAIHPGAGFADVKFYQKLTPEKYPVWYEQVLWGLYDVPDYVRNFLNTPTIAYSGELDAQKATGDYMVGLINKEQPNYVPHIIGKNMPHKYSPEGLDEVMKLVNAAVKKGRDTHPKQVHFQTKTLRYNKMFWVEVLGLGEHWQQASVEATLVSDKQLEVKTTNVTALKLYPPKANWKQFPAGFTVVVDGKPTKITKPQATVEVGDIGKGLRKEHGLTGPMDDALYEPFLVVLPSGKSKNELVQRWVDFEIAHFEDRWSSIYRGSLRTKKDTEVTPEDIKNYHLIAWGDADSNKIIAQTAGKLPIKWAPGSVQAGEQTFDGPNYVPIMVYPNPLNPRKYLVINSGNTFREGHDSTNSQQNPKLPDWAVIDLNTLPDALAPGKVVAADFFDESWQLKNRKVDPASREVPK